MMGDVSDAITEGERCALCGVFFMREHGFPVLCGWCWRNTPRIEREGYSKATKPEAGGAS